MNKELIMKVVGLFILFGGEFLAIYGEMLAAKHGWNNLNLLIKPFIIMIIAGILLMLGYVVCYMYFKNIRIVTVISITGIFIVEPILAWGFFHELPTKGATIGFVFGILGGLSTILIK